VKKNSIKKHLARYSIFHKRRTTINHAFASALAPQDEYDEQRLDEALKFLGQDPDGDLRCVFCGRPAATWDHLVSLVKDGVLRGFGHQLGNLVPCCAVCNSAKGAKDWDVFIASQAAEGAERSELLKLLAAYNARFAQPVDLERAKRLLPDEWSRYMDLKRQIFELMREADVAAARLRVYIRDNEKH
jgi:hypothetical protein